MLLGAILASRRRLDWTEAVFVVGTFGLALLSGRNLPLFAIAAVPIATSRMDEALTRRGWSIRRRARESPYRVIINLALIGLVAAGMPLLRLEYVSNDNTVNAAVAHNWPIDAIRHLNARADAGNLFNSYNWGGYLIFAARNHPVFIDGRTDLHRDLLADYVAARGGRAWRVVFEKWDIALALIETKSSTGGAA